MQGLSIKDAHLLRDIGDAQAIEHGQQKTVEHGENARSVSLAHLTVIFASPSLRGNPMLVGRSLGDCVARFFSLMDVGPDLRLRMV